MIPVKTTEVFETDTVFGTNTAHDLKDLPYQTDLTNLQCSAKFIIHNPKTGERLAFGPGVAALCEGVREYGSLSAAAKSMGMSYSKAWKIVGEAEEALRVKLVIRQKPKGFVLTADGEKLLNAYIEIAQDLANYAQFRFHQKLADMEC